MKKVIIHAGPGKTGSSVIQHWLSTNTSFLRRNGILYPKHYTDDNQVSSGNFKKIMSRSMDGKWKPDEEKIKHLLKSFENDDCQTLLLSSEHFFKNILKFNQIIPNSEFIIYLRNPIEQAESNYNQGVKRHSHTHRFQIHPSKKFGLLAIIENFILENGIKITIHPYFKEKFIGGNIVSDFLHILGLNANIESVPVINPSYTYELLEFKRNANYFPIRDFQHKLDRVLQGCDIGQAHYTFIEPSLHKELAQNYIDQLEQFIRRCDQNQLLPLKEQLLNIERKKYIEQGTGINQEAFDAIVSYIKKQSIRLYNVLYKKVSPRPYLLLPNEAFYFSLGVNPEKGNIYIDRIKFQTFLEKKVYTKGRHNAEVCKEIAKFLEQEGYTNAANYFMEAALSLKSKDPIVRKKVNEYRIRAKRFVGKDYKSKICSLVKKLTLKFRGFFNF